MNGISEPVAAWWGAFSLMISDFFTNMGPKEYGYILVLTGIAGYLFMKSGKH